MEEQIPKDQNKTSIAIAVGGLIVLFILLAVFISRKQLQKTAVLQPTPQEQKVVPTIKPKQGSITLKKATASNLTISLDSMGFDVVGYDVILTYDPQQLEIVQASSLLPEFTLFKIKRENYMVLTGAKKLSATAQTVLTNKDVINVTVKPKISGTISLNIMTQQGKETTKFVDDKSAIHYPQVGSINIETAK